MNLWLLQRTLLILPPCAQGLCQPSSRPAQATLVKLSPWDSPDVLLGIAPGSVRYIKPPLPRGCDACARPTQ